MFISYRLIIAFYVLKQWIFNIKTGKFIVRKSPLDNIQIILIVGASSMRTTTRFTVGIGMTYALCYELDETLISEGKEPYFIPRVISIIREMGLEKPVKSFAERIGIKDRVEPSNLDIYTNKLSDEEKSAFEESTGLKWDDFEKAHETAMKKRKGENSTKVSVSSFFEKEEPKKNKGQPPPPYFSWSYFNENISNILISNV